MRLIDYCWLAWLRFVKHICPGFNRNAGESFNVDGVSEPRRATLTGHQLGHVGLSKAQESGCFGLREASALHPVCELCDSAVHGRNYTEGLPDWQAI